MHRTPRSLLILAAISIMLIGSLPSSVHASPGPDIFYSRPTAHVDSGIATSPGDAYDNDNNTFTQVNRGASGTFDVVNFTRAAGVVITVDLVMRYRADAGSDDTYAISYDIGGTSITLVGPTAAGASLSTVTWSSVARPGGGSWTWSDIPKLRVRITTVRARGDDGADFYEYETWAIIDYTPPSMYVSPANQTVSASFSIDINVSSAGNFDLYGWEFKLYYNTSIITCPGTANVTEGALLATGGSTFFSVIEVNDTYTASLGRVWATATLLGDVAGVSANGTIATIDFTIDANGVSSLDLQNTKMVGYDYTYTKTTFNIPHITTDGSVTTSGAVPEFPLGAALEISLVIAIAYVWLRRRKSPKSIRYAPI